MNEPLDERYLIWLYQQIGSVKLKNRARTHWTLARALFTKEFVWLIPNDDNRLEDGRDLRWEFAADCEITVDPEWMGLGCSMLEMLIGLSRRFAFEIDREPRECFWRMIDNLGLAHLTDARTNEHTIEEIHEVLDRVIWRTYEPSGRGGLFPLRHPESDQTLVEIWYQLSAYILERED